jgi:hypothetical protein
MRRLLCLATIASTLFGANLSAQPVALPYGVQQLSIDSDHDGLSDELEQALLTQFKPVFMVSHADCSGVPAEFSPENRNPIVQSEDGTIYGQVFPGKPEDVATEPTIEIHYYHLWKKDCGRMGHALDAEHVSVLLRTDTNRDRYKPGQTETDTKEKRVGVTQSDTAKLRSLPCPRNLHETSKHGSYTMLVRIILSGV